MGLGFESVSDSKIASWVPECLMEFFVFLNFLPTESESLRAGPGPLIFNNQNLIDVQPTLRTLPSYTASSKCHSHVSNHLLNIPPGHSPAFPLFLLLRASVSPAGRGDSQLLPSTAPPPSLLPGHSVSPTHALLCLCCLHLGKTLHHCWFGLLQQPPNSSPSDCLYFSFSVSPSLPRLFPLLLYSPSTKSSPHPLSCQT